MMKMIFCAVFCLLFAEGACAASYDGFVLQSSGVTESKTGISIEMSLGVPPDGAVENALQGGAILKFSIQTSVSRHRFLLPDSKVFSREIISYLRFDNLTRQYMMLEEAKTAFRTRDINELMEKLLRDIRLDLGSRWEKGESYEAEIGVSLTRDSSAGWVDRNVLFLPRDIVKPLTFTEEFTY